jgi:hypothetical protein
MIAAGSTTPSRQRLAGTGGFAVASLLLIGIAAVGLNFVFRDQGDARSIWISAALAWVTQLAAFPFVRRLTSVNLMTGWAVGSLVRMGTLLVYALVASQVLELSMTSALVGLALFYFVSMVIEPLFLRS